MSALAGYIQFECAEIDHAVLDRIQNAMGFIKADSIHQWSSGKAGFIHFKYATTPEAVAETQPLQDSDSGNVIVFDGRLDNRPELLQKLRSFIDLDPLCSDSTILMQLFHHYGETVPTHLVGDYAFAIWSPREQRLFCARSPLGWRTFCWYADSQRFAFASEPKALVAGLELSPKINESVMGEQLSMRFVSQTETLWQGISRLPPGSAMRVANGKVNQWHWHTDLYDDFEHSDSEAAEHFLELFDQSLKSCTRSNTEIASHLSGGLDSSSIVCRANSLFNNGNMNKQLHLLSVRYHGDANDEGFWMAAVEAHIGREATPIIPPAYSWDKARAWCAKTGHLPLRPNVMGTCVASFAHLQQQGIRVLLTGEGGDDWLRGSNAHLADYLRTGQLQKLWHDAMVLPKGRYLGRLKRMLEDSAGPLLIPSRKESLLRHNLIFSHQPPPWLRPEWAEKTGLRERWQNDKPPVTLPSLALQQRAARYTFARVHIGTDNVLALARSKGVEIRHPLHDLRLTRYLMGVPGNLLFRGDTTKYLLRIAMQGILPEQVRTRTGKGDLSNPFMDALQEIFSEVQVKDLICVQAGWVKPEKITEYFEVNRAWYQSDRKARWPDAPLNAVWAAVATELWLKHAMSSS